MTRESGHEHIDRDPPAGSGAAFAGSLAARTAPPERFGSDGSAQRVKRRGRPKSGQARTPISLRLPADTLARWKATGAGWQTRMAEALGKLV